MIVVTGAAGFIGANIVNALNQRGEENILAVDNLEAADKFVNLRDCRIRDYMDKNEFLKALETPSRFKDIEVMFHQGACSNTMETDGRYMMENNYRYSRILCDFCQQNNIRFLYASSASVYGDGLVFTENEANEKPLNIYAYSKWLFDQYARGLIENTNTQIVGMRYFNVYGHHEQHKGRMASVAFHFRNQWLENRQIRLFEGSDGYENGEQRRDFVYVKDVALVNMFFADNPGISGLFNVATGRSQSFNDVALAVINSQLQQQNQDVISLQQAIDADYLSYIPMPEALKGKYQSFTQADIGALHHAGYNGDFKTVEQGVADYLKIIALLN